MHRLPGEKRRARRRARGRRDERVGESRALTGDAVEVRRAERSIAVNARVRERPVVGDGEDDVGASCLGGGGCADPVEQRRELAHLVWLRRGEIGSLAGILGQIVELRLGVVAGFGVRVLLDLRSLARRDEFPRSLPERQPRRRLFDQDGPPGLRRAEERRQDVLAVHLRSRGVTASYGGQVSLWFEERRERRQQIHL